MERTSITNLAAVSNIAANIIKDLEESGLGLVKLTDEEREDLMDSLVIEEVRGELNG